MQADDMNSKEYLHENLYYCTCLFGYEILKLEQFVFGPTGEKYSNGRFDYYKTPKAFVLMSRHPFFNLFIDILG
jgi:hypothetical protein